MLLFFTFTVFSGVFELFYFSEFIFATTKKNGFVDFLCCCCFAPSYSNVEFFSVFLSSFLFFVIAFPRCYIVYHNRMSMDHRI